MVLLGTHLNNDILLDQQYHFYPVCRLEHRHSCNTRGLSHPHTNKENQTSQIKICLGHSALRRPAHIKLHPLPITEINQIMMSFLTVAYQNHT